MKNHLQNYLLLLLHKLRLRENEPMGLHARFRSFGPYLMANWSRKIPSSLDPQKYMAVFWSAGVRSSRLKNYFIFFV